MPGTLFVVATPIGNLEDLTFRALRVLKECDVIAAEDTRRTSKLLAHYEIRKPLLSLREHNEVREIPRLIERLASGQSVALVSDAGTPTIADPGVRLVRAAREAGQTVVPIPGANAIAAALSASGIPADQFTFMGFPPATGQARQRWFQTLAKESRTVVFYESPHRIIDTLSEIDELSIKRQIVIAREITKIHEEFVIKPNSQQYDGLLRAVGEFTVIVGLSQESRAKEPVDEAEAISLFGLLTENESIGHDVALELVSLKHGLSRKAIEKALKRAKISAKQQKPSLP